MSSSAEQQSHGGSSGSGSTPAAGPNAAAAANIRVYVRVRPLNARELSTGASAAAPCLSVVPAASSAAGSATTSSSSASTTKLVQLHAKPDARLFAFDEVADERASQADVFERVGRPITEACLAGYNGTIFAYGQTGSGKTFTIQGINDAPATPATGSAASPNELRGLMPRVFEYLTAQIAREEARVRSNGSTVRFNLRASFLEIYNERTFDLLDPCGGANSNASATALPLREDTRRGVYVEGLVEQPVRTARELQSLMEKGVVARRVGETAMNRESSRSHCVFTLHVSSTTRSSSGALVEKRSSRFNLIDLAGSERQKQTQASGTTMVEARSINKSLAALGNVIRELMKRSTTNSNARGGAGGSGDDDSSSAGSGGGAHVPYRDSKLTFLLRDSLGGNSLTWLVACVSSAGSAFFESLSTLKFAQMANSVTNNARVNAEEQVQLLQQQSSVAAAAAATAAATAQVESLKCENERLKQQVARMMAAQTLGARRISMIMPSLASANGLVTPTKLLPAGGASTTAAAAGFSSIAEEGANDEPDAVPSHEAAMAPVAPSTALQLSELSALLSASSAREQRWEAELRAHKEQIELLQRKQEHDGMLLRIRDKLVATLRSKTVGGAADDAAMTEEDVDAVHSLRAENAALQAELAAMSSSVAAVTHAPNVVAMQQRLHILADRIAELKKQQQDVDAGDDIDNEEQEDVIKDQRHHMEAKLQAQLLSLGSKHATLSAAYAAVLEGGAVGANNSSDLDLDLDCMASPARRGLESSRRLRCELEVRVRDSEANLAAEKDMVAHLEAQLAHALEEASSERRAHEEALLMQKGVALRAESERATLARSLASLEAAQAEQTRAWVAAQGSHSEEMASITSSLRAEAESWRSRSEQSERERTSLAQESFELSQRLKLQELQHERLEASLAAAKRDVDEHKAARSAEAAQAAKQVELISTQRDEARSQLAAAQSELADVSATLSSRTASLSLAEAEVVSSTSRAALLKEELDATSFRLDGVQEDIDTLNQEFAFQAAALEAERLARTKAEESVASLARELETAQAATRAKEDALTALQSEHAAAQRLRAEGASAEARAMEELRESMSKAQAELTQRLAASEADNEVLGEQLAALQSDLAAREADLVSSRAEHASASRSVAELTAALQDYSARLGTTSTDLAARTEQVQEANTRCTELETQVDSLSAERDALEQERAHALAQLEQAEQEIARGDELLRIQAQQQDSTNAKVANMQRDLEQAHGQLDAKAGAIKGLEEQISAQEAEMASLRAQMQRREEELAQVGQDKEQLERQLAHVMRAANEQSELAAAQLHGVAEAEAAQRARQAALNAAALEASRSETSSARAAEAQALTDLNQAKKEFAASRLAFEQKQAEFASLVGSFEAHGAALKQELSSLRAQMASKDTTLTQTQAQLASLQSERAANESALVSLKAQVASLTTELSSVRKSASEAAAAHDSALTLSLQSEVSSLSERVDQLLRERKSWLRELESTRADESAALSSATNLAAQLSSAQENLSIASDKLATAQAEVANLQEQNAALAGHHNPRQKIQLHQQIKKENDALRADKNALERELRKWRKMHALWVANGTVPSGSGSAAGVASLDKDLQLADEHLRLGEVAQSQLRALLAHVAKLEAKVRASAALHATTTAAASAASATSSTAPSPANSRLTSPNASAAQRSSSAAALGDITNQQAPVTVDGAVKLSAEGSLIVATAAAAAVTAPAAAAGDPFAQCLHLLSGLAAQVCSSHTQVEALRRELSTARKQAKLQQLKQELHRAARRSSGHSHASGSSRRSSIVGTAVNSAVATDINADDQETSPSSHKRNPSTPAAPSSPDD